MSNRKHDEIDDISPEEVLDENDNGLEENQIYEHGKYHGINVEELLNNEVAIRQVINNYNSQRRKLSKIEEDFERKNTEINILKIQPFVLIICITFNIFATVILSLGVNLLTGQSELKLGLFLLWMGIAGELIGNGTPVIYPVFVNRIILRNN